MTLGSTVRRRCLSSAILHRTERTPLRDTDASQPLRDPLLWQSPY